MVVRHNGMECVKYRNTVEQYCTVGVLVAVINPVCSEL
jgi:hypothetical protein